MRATDALKTVENRKEEEQAKEKERKNARSWKAKGKEQGEARNCGFHSDLYLKSPTKSIQGCVPIVNSVNFKYFVFLFNIR